MKMLASFKGHSDTKNYSSNGVDYIYGGTGSDNICGWGGNDQIYHGTSDHRNLSDGGNDIIYCGQGSIDQVWHQPTSIDLVYGCKAINGIRIGVP